jgi:hypothetical protein
MAGRALRLYEGKKDALLLDVMGASTRHKLASIVDLTGRSLAEPKEGRSLGETADDEDLAAPIGSVEWEDVNLFHESPVRWLQTDAGVWFIPLTSSMFLFLVRGSGPGLYRVRRWDAHVGVRPPSPDREASLAETMRWTEEQARGLVHPSYLARAAQYRGKEPSTKQRGWCRFNRIRIPAGSTAGDVSDLMDIHNVGKTLAACSVASAA